MGHELVQTFPMVAFHQPSQKFAVGTNDGLVIVYDLRTATKWRILEGHTGAVSAIAFTKDGSQLASYSAKDSGLRLWQCSSTGFLGGILGSSGRCIKQHGLPSCSVRAANKEAMPVGAAPGSVAADEGGWRNVSLSYT